MTLHPTSYTNVFENLFIGACLIPQNGNTNKQPRIRFLDASKHLYKRVCPSVRPSVCPSVRSQFRFRTSDASQCPPGLVRCFLVYLQESLPVCMSVRPYVRPSVGIKAKLPKTGPKSLENIDYMYESTTDASICPPGLVFFSFFKEK